jgi:hypothetical protein
MTAHEPTKSQIEIMDGPHKGQCHERDITRPVPVQIMMRDDNSNRIGHVYRVDDFQGFFVRTDKIQLKTKPKPPIKQEDGDGEPEED